MQREKRPLIVYVHPREIDPDHQRLPLGPWRSFKCYNNLGTTFPKLRWLCENNRFGTMAELASRVGKEAGHGTFEVPRECQVSSVKLEVGTSPSDSSLETSNLKLQEADAELT